MIRKAIEIAAPKPTPVEMEILWVRNRLPDPDLKFRKEMLAEPLQHTPEYRRKTSSTSL